MTQLSDGPIRSMTGHGVGEAELGLGRVVLEVRAVNHRYLDVRVRLPIELGEHAGAIEEMVRRSLRRGHVEVVARLEGDIAGPPTLDRARARAAFAQLCELRDELRPDEPVPLSVLFSMPDLFVRRSVADHDAARAALFRATEQACAEVWTMRAREGAALTEDLVLHLDTITSAVDAVHARSPEVVESYRERLRQRIERLLAGSERALDPGRLEHEVALFADRADVTEEVTRLRSHCVQVRDLLNAADDSAGKRLDFLLQEMSREANTIGSKSTDTDLARLVIDMKAAISRMREQAQNVL
jgi:uncharacterized protein (TIGR00255 family)